MASSASSFDLFASENSEQAKEMIKTSLRHEIKRLRTRAISESGSDDHQTHKNEHSPSPTTVPKSELNQRPTTMLYTGPKFRSSIIQSEDNFTSQTIYPVSVGFLSSVFPSAMIFSSIRFLLAFFRLFFSYGNQFLH